MSKIVAHTESYTGLPYLATVYVGEEVHTAVVDFINDDHLAYYHLESMGIENSSKFLELVEVYHNTGKSLEVPLSIFLSQNHHDDEIVLVRRVVAVKVLDEVRGFCPVNWFPSTKTRWRRLSIDSGRITSSKHRRTQSERDADEKARLAKLALNKRKRDAVRSMKKSG